MAQNTGKEMYEMLQATGNPVIKMETNNPLLCDPETGLCELPVHYNAAITATAELADEKPVKIIYYTDPICSSCWGIEPQLRKLKLEYGDSIDIDYKMGGLLPDWSYNSGGISKPADVAHHWDEVSMYYDMPIDGDIWLEDPLHSSYPPSIAFKAAQLQDTDKAVLFLRELRELLFLQKKNIARWEHIEAAAVASGLNIMQLKTDYESRAVALFEDDLALAKKMGVRGFPSMFFTDANGRQEFVYGTKPYEAYENALLKLYPLAKKKTYSKQLKDLFSKFQSLTAKEFSELSGMNRTETETMLNDLAATAVLQKLNSKNGAMWKLQNNSAV